MPSTTVEREARFLVSDPSVHRAVARLASLGAFRVIRRKRERQHNTYFDTTDMRLWRAKAVLKLRETPSTREVTFKKALAYRNGVASRLEVTSRIRPTQRALMAQGRLALAPMRRAKRIIGTHRLQRLFTIVTDRTTLILAQDGARVELDIDRVAVHKGRKMLARRLEIEVENLTAPHAVFREAMATLRRRYGRHLRLSGVSKFEFGFSTIRTLRS
jgi:inorganic triphosphatase YgiF